MKRTLLFFLIVLPFSLTAQIMPLEHDEIDTDEGVVKIYPILHGSVALQWDGKNIFIDPYGGAEGFEGVGEPDIIFITDIHGDHLHMNTINALNTVDVQFVVPQAVYDKLPADLQKQATIMANGEEKELAGLSVQAIPMYNLPNDETARHPKGRGNGYILTIGGKKIYFSGDTEGIPEMRALENIDVAFVCMNLPYTMDVDQAADAVLDFKPTIVYPYHYRGSEGLSDVSAFQQLVKEGNPAIEVRLRDWYRTN